MSLPVPSSTTSFWRQQPHKLDSFRSTPELPETTDILIIGSGYAGAACAYYLTKDSPSPAPSICMLEAREACSGATGRNGGHIKPDTYYNIAELSKLYGPEAAAAVARYEASQVKAVKQLIEDEKIDCDFHLTRAVDVFLDPKIARDTEKDFEQLRADAAVDLADVQHISNPTTASRISNVKSALSAYTFTAAHLWPFKLVTSLLALALSRSTLNLQTHTPLLSISSTRDNQGYYTCTTPRGSIRAKHIISCTNAYTASILPQLASRIIPVRGIAAHIACPDPSKAPHLPNTYALRFVHGLMDYLIPRPDGSIIVGGARETFVKDLGSWYGNVDDSRLINEKAARYFDGYMQRHFRGWEESGAVTKRVWTGIMGYSADDAPWVGKVPGMGGGVWMMGGYTGHGMPAILGSAKAVVEELRMEEAGVKGGEGSLWKGLRTLPGVYRITEERMRSQSNLVLDDWGRTWEGKARL